MTRESEWTKDAVPAMSEMLSENARRRLPHPPILLPGDLAWRLPGAEPETKIRLFRAGEVLNAFVWFEPDTGFEFEWRATLRDPDPLLQAVFDWACERRAALPPAYPRFVDITDMDAWRRLGKQPFRCPTLPADTISGIGHFEPVGTRPEWRGTGAGRAVIHEGLRRLRNAGMRWARVSTAGLNHPAQALYRSCGFERADTERTFIRKLD